MSACDKITTINFRPKFLANVRMAVFEKETCKAKPPLQILGFSFVDCDQIDHPMSAINVVRLMSLLQCYHDHLFKVRGDLLTVNNRSQLIFDLERQSCHRYHIVNTNTGAHIHIYIHIHTHTFTHSHIHAYTHTYCT